MMRRLPAPSKHLLGVALFAIACGSTSDPAPTPNDGGDVNDAGPVDASDASPASASCTKDGDCRTFEFTCEACECLALTIGALEPTCDRPPVSCFAPACRGKVAACQDGTCKVVASP